MTSWNDLGRVITTGPSLPLAGEPRAIDGHARDRYVYAPIDGVFRTTFRIGDAGRQGQEVAHINSTALGAPLDGVLRGLTRDAVPRFEQPERYKGGDREAGSIHP
jgi:xanthine dehydrogenase accessory factor